MDIEAATTSVDVVCDWQTNGAGLSDNSLSLAAASRGKAADVDAARITVFASALKDQPPSGEVDRRRLWHTRHADGAIEVSERPANKARHTDAARDPIRKGAGACIAVDGGAS
ncbi:MAG: hypothetical protein ACJAYU_003810 [Bradymonadia bacterium]|jgi:hypothetical protein